MTIFHGARDMDMPQDAPRDERPLLGPVLAWLADALALLFTAVNAIAWPLLLWALLS